MAIFRWRSPFYEHFREFRELDRLQDEVNRFLNTETMLAVTQAEKIIHTRIDLFRKKRGIRWAITRRGHSGAEGRGDPD